PLVHFLGTTCPTPISVEHADIRVKNYSVNSRERYVCNSGFKRKAGTSTLTECVINKNTNTAHWTTPNLKCIRDPSLAHQSPVLPSTVVTPKVTPQPESPSPPEKEISPNTSEVTKVAISTSVLVLLVGVGLAVFFTRYIKSRQASQPRDVAMETMESMPMTVRTSSNEDDTGA
ncbi:Interleukin-15 receptor subunit alpha, partial [Lemmus lemmus]